MVGGYIIQETKQGINQHHKRIYGLIKDDYICWKAINIFNRENIMFPDGDCIGLPAVRKPTCFSLLICLVSWNRFPKPVQPQNSNKHTSIFSNNFPAHSFVRHRVIHTICISYCDFSPDWFSVRLSLSFTVITFMFEQVLSLWQRENTMTNTNIHDQAGFEAGVTRSKGKHSTNLVFVPSSLQLLLRPPLFLVVFFYS